MPFIAKASFYGETFLFAFHSALRCANIMNGRINAQIRFCKWKTLSLYCFWRRWWFQLKRKVLRELFELFFHRNQKILFINFRFIPNLYLDSAGRRRKQNFLFHFPAINLSRKDFSFPFYDTRSLSCEYYAAFMWREWDGISFKAITFAK